MIMPETNSEISPQALDATTVQDLIKRLEEDRKAHLESVNKTHELLKQLISASAAGSSSVPFTSERSRRYTGTTLATTLDFESVQKSSTLSANDESETDEDEALYVQDPLPAESYDEDGLKKHIREYNWTDAGKNILQGLLDKPEILQRSSIFPTQDPAEDRSHLSHYTIYDGMCCYTQEESSNMLHVVGNDGAPVELQFATPTEPKIQAREIWRRISSVNADQTRLKRAVGRITIIREPSPSLFAALHYTLNKHFDVDEMFQLLDGNKTMAIPHRPWDDDPRHRRTFLFTFEYFTIVEEVCIPMKWQQADEDLAESDTHIPVSRCSSVIGLSLEGEPISRPRRKGRRHQTGRRDGEIFDPFSPWRVVSMQAYPDLKSSIDAHNPTKHYVNGPEAFLMTLRTEFKDAQKRITEVYTRISNLVTTPPNFMFKRATRDKLLFEDDEFTMSRRYFWAYQSLAVLNEDIKEMINAYRTNFKESIWTGQSRVIWPGDENSPRYANFLKRMESIRQDIEREIRGLEKIDHDNDEKMKEIKALRENLFSGTSVLESRKAIQQQAITVIQGHNIKVLTLVTIFFLPLTFVTSVFGMTNMDPNDNFVHFGIVTVVICVPTYMLIGSLNTGSGFEFWSTLFTRNFWKHQVGLLCSIFGYKPDWAPELHKTTSEYLDSHAEDAASNAACFCRH